MATTPCSVRFSGSSLPAEPAESLAAYAADNIVVLRSPGKFFGLAGVRFGLPDSEDQWQRLTDGLEEIT